MAEAPRAEFQSLAGDQPGSARLAWVSPELTELPRLTELTLQTGGVIPGTGNTGGGGSTVF
jgi:hypothetical protein